MSTYLKSGTPLDAPKTFKKELVSKSIDISVEIKPTENIVTGVKLVAASEITNDNLPPLQNEKPILGNIQDLSGMDISDYQPNLDASDFSKSIISGDNLETSDIKETDEIIEK